MRKEIISVNSLKERSWGDLEGADRACLKEKSAQELPADAETFEDFEARILKALCPILEMSSVTPLIVAHSGVFIALTKMMGYPSLRASNCIPFLCKPPEQKTHSWRICNLWKEDIL